MSCDFAAAIDAEHISEALCKSDQFKKVQNLVEAELSLDKISSNTGIRNRAMCAKHCINEGCLSFSYTEVNKKCDTYSRFIVEKKDADVFLKGPPPLCCEFETRVDQLPNTESSGVYDFITTEGENLKVFYDTDTEDGPWIVIQRRTNGDVDFYRNWEDYKNGFGNIQYSTFHVANEAQNYRLSVQGFSGNISYDALSAHDGYDFTTFDRDNDDQIGENCAHTYLGAWWYSNCFFFPILTAVMLQTMVILIPKHWCGGTFLTRSR
ncbi:ficolin-1-A-like [Pecten maximus]|uniref:ficolin-1-A-like n=1 Tax=Pecten maximus TaxID=6579 RepID=UPI001458FB40|nr:ficolin-1-A-like [Pecten maximus]